MTLKFSLRPPLILLVGACILACGCEAGSSGSTSVDPPYQFSAEMKSAIEKNLLEKNRLAKNHKAPRRSAR